MTEPTASAPAPGDADGVRALARAAALPLPDDRVAAVTGLLGQWLPAANALSAAMSAPEHQTTMPLTVVASGPTDRTE